MISGGRLLRYSAAGVGVAVMAALIIALPSRPPPAPPDAAASGSGAAPIAPPALPPDGGRDQLAEAPAVSAERVSAAPAPTRASAVGRAPGDTSHCTPDGRQFGVIYRSPPCVPRWPKGADNGGATASGVSRDRVRIVIFEAQVPPILNEILATEGLAMTEAEADAFNQAAQDFLARNYETYGRSLEFIRYKANCPYVPPRPIECLLAARDVVRMDPFLVVFGSPVYPAVFEEWARAGIVSIGGMNFEATHFNDRRPLRYDVYMDGTTSARLAGEYYCKKLVDKRASHSGALIHSSIGLRDAVVRRLGIVVPELDVAMSGAQELRSLVDRCGDGPAPTVVTYDHDLARAGERSAALVARLVADGVTTVVCLCEPVFPVFLTRTMTEQRYFPEHFLAGSGLLDVDAAGRLYDPSQWAHAFGLSHLADPLPHPQTDAAKVWRASGRSGEPCRVCNALWSYYNLIGSLIHMAGPRLDPLTVERGAFDMGSRGGWAESGGRPDVYRTEFGPGDYTWISDAREVHWSPQSLSPADGRPGRYISVDGGRRYAPGEWPTRFAVPVPAS